MPTQERLYAFPLLAARETHLRFRTGSACAVIACKAISVILADSAARDRRPTYVSSDGMFSAVKQTRDAGAQVLVLDEADRLLDAGYGKHLEALMRRLPKQRRTGGFLLTSVIFSHFKVSLALFC